MKLSKKAKDFLDKLKPKAQDGLSFPYIVGESNDLAMDTSPIMFNGIDVNPVNESVNLQPAPSFGKEALSSLGQGSNTFSQAVKGIMTIDNFIKARKAKRNYKAQKKIFDQEYKRSQEELRANDFYATPYTVGRTDDYTLKKGGKIKYQGGGDFMQYYLSQKQKNNNVLDLIKSSYDQQNVLNKQTYQGYQQAAYQGVGDYISSGIQQVEQAAKLLMQQGGEAPNLYDPEFEAKYQTYLGEEQQAVASEVDQEMEFDNTLLNWIFQEEPEESTSPTYDVYQQEMNPYLLPSTGSFIEQVGKKESGNNYGAVNRSGGKYSTNATGKYQFTTVWSDQIKSFMGLPQSMSKSEVMESFRQSPEAQESFMQHVTNDIYAPVVEQYRERGRQYGFTDNQLFSLIHYRGVGDFKKRMSTGDWDTISDSEKKLYNNPTPRDYIKNIR